MKAEFDFAAAEDGAAERRGEHRTTAVYRPVLIETEESAGFCLPRNMSPSGMMGVAYAQFATDQPVTVLDISQQGIKAAASFVMPGDEAVVRLEGLEPHKAEVRRTQAGMAGLKFIRPIGFEELAKWIVQRQST